MVIGQKKRTSVTSPSLSLLFSCLSMLASSVFFYSSILLSPSSSRFAFELSSCVCVLLRSITPLFHTCTTCYGILQCTTLSNITITIDIHQNVFVHMQWYANEEKKRVDLSSILHIHVRICTQSRIITSRNDRSSREYYYKTENTNIYYLSSFSFF
jgi:hypothetical protein